MQIRSESREDPRESGSVPLALVEVGEVNLAGEVQSEENIGET